MLHLKDIIQDGVTFITLWGGPVRTQADNILGEDEASVREWGCVLTSWSERMGDDGLYWQRTLVLAGLDIFEVRLDEEQRPHVRLYNGSWLVFDCDGTDLAEEAYMRGILDLGDRMLPEARSWQSLGVQAISIVNELAE